MVYLLYFLIQCNTGPPYKMRLDATINDTFMQLKYHKLIIRMNVKILELYQNCFKFLGMTIYSKQSCNLIIFSFFQRAKN